MKPLPVIATAKTRQIIHHPMAAAPHTPGRAGARAFTSLELVCVIATLSLVALIILPSLAGGNPRVDRVICANNLRQIGLAFQLWGHNHDDLPMFEVPTGAGGTRMHVLAPNVWLHFAWLSNELATPQWLLCPSDSGRPARDFTGDPDGGYLHPNFANRATSYFLAHPFLPAPGGVIAGDRNVGFEAVTACSRFGNALGVTTIPASVAFRWTNGLHGTSGNVLHQDGSVEQLSSAGLRKSVADARADNGTFHFITPR
jgi:prepilin-type processing-associated H-X9-DG protein